MISQKTIAILLGAIAFFVFIVWISSSATYPSTVELNGKIFHVDVADTKALLEKGLSGRKFIATNQGMLFVFQAPGTYGFWMKDMNFPIDILWLDGDYKIVHMEKYVHQGTYPKVFSPPVPARYVLELFEGQADVVKAKIGDVVKFQKN
jgi:uncharacterized protein